MRLTQSAQGLLDQLAPGKHPAPVCSVTSSEVARFLRHFFTGCATSCALVLRDLFFNLFVIFLSLASQAFLSFCVDMWHGILFEEPNHTRSRPSDPIGLCKKHVSSFSHCLLLNIECPFLSSASSGLPHHSPNRSLGRIPVELGSLNKIPVP